MSVKFSSGESVQPTVISCFPLQLNSKNTSYEVSGNYSTHFECIFSWKLCGKYQNFKFLTPYWRRFSGPVVYSCPTHQDTCALVSFNFMLNKNEFSTNKRFKKAFENIFKRWTNFRTGFPRVGQNKWMTCFQFETAMYALNSCTQFTFKDTRKLENCPSRSKSKNG